MTQPAGNGLFVIERILRDRDGIWQQIVDERDLHPLIRQMLASSVVSLAVYGAVLGLSYGWLQALSSLIKLPLLFLATLAICLPTLYLFNLVFGARLTLVQAVALIMVSITVTAVLTLAFAPISLFFLVTAQSYSFYKLLNVAILLLTAVVGLRFLTVGMRALNDRQPAGAVPVSAQPVPGAVPVSAQPVPGAAPVSAQPVPAAAPASAQPVPAAAPASVVPAPVQPEPVMAGVPGGAGQPAGAGPLGVPHPVPPAYPAQRNGAAGTQDWLLQPAPAAAPVDDRPPASMALLYIWILLFGFVGTQLAWTLRPFFGSPGEPFGLFRNIGGTFYADVLRTIGHLLGG